jgi:hypothetical protein
MRLAEKKQTHHGDNHPRKPKPGFLGTLDTETRRRGELSTAKEKVLRVDSRLRLCFLRDPRASLVGVSCDRS